MTRRIRTGQYSFLVGSPFAEGHKLTANEAEALNQLRAENIRNNVKKLVDRATKQLPPGEVLAPAELSELNDRVARYISGYEFGSGSSPNGGVRQTAFEAELRSIASDRLDTQLRAAGVALSPEAYEAEIEKITREAEVIDEARARLAVRREVSAQALQDLIG